LNQTQLITVFEFANPEDVVGVRANDRLAVSCPICPEKWITLASGGYTSCPTCNVQLAISSPPSLSAQGEGYIDCGIMQIPTYKNEYVKLVLRDEQLVWVSGRLDLLRLRRFRTSGDLCPGRDGPSSRFPMPD
jgi:hypothetical protein